jgi:hypothetical protein
MYDYNGALVKHLGFDLTLNDNGLNYYIGTLVYHPPFDPWVGRILWFERCHDCWNIVVLCHYCYA